MRLLLSILLIMACGCKTAAPNTQPETKPQARGPQKKEGPATRKVEEREAEMQDELDFTLGDPVHSRVRKQIEDGRFTKSYGRPGK